MNTYNVEVAFPKENIAKVASWFPEKRLNTFGQAVLNLKVAGLTHDAAQLEACRLMANFMSLFEIKSLTMITKTLEYCFVCSAPTGRAGRGDDSIYDENGEGPYCLDCWHELKPEGYEDET